MEKKLYKEKLYARPWRWVKTIFFLLTMLASLLLVCAPPLLIVVLDLLLPPALVSSSLAGPPVSFAAQLRRFSFRSSIVDIPLISVARSLLILCAYAICDGKGSYLGITTLCSLSSILYLVTKGILMFRFPADQAAGGTSSPSMAGTAEWWYRFNFAGKADGEVAVEALFFISAALAVAHVIVAYRTSCRERKKLLVYRIDIEAVKLKAVQIKGSR